MSYSNDRRLLKPGDFEIKAPKEQHKDLAARVLGRLTSEQLGSIIKQLYPEFENSLQDIKPMVFAHPLRSLDSGTRKVVVKLTFYNHNNRELNIVLKVTPLLVNKRELEYQKLLLDKGVKVPRFIRLSELLKISPKELYSDKDLINHAYFETFFEGTLLSETERVSNQQILKITKFIVDVWNKTESYPDDLFDKSIMLMPDNSIGLIDVLFKFPLEKENLPDFIKLLMIHLWYKPGKAEPGYKQYLHEIFDVLVYDLQVNPFSTKRALMLVVKSLTKQYTEEDWINYCCVDMTKEHHIVEEYFDLKGWRN